MDAVTRERKQQLAESRSGGHGDRLDEALALYQEEHYRARNYSVRTREEYTADLADLLAFLRERRGLSAVDQVTLAHLEGYLAELDRRGLKGTSRRRKVASIRSFLSFCTRRGFLAVDVSQQLVPPAREYDEPRMLTEAEYKRLQLAVAHETRDAAIIELFLQTGLRLSELSALRMGDITLPAKITRDEDNTGTAFVQGKGRRQRVVPLNWKACKALAAYLKVRPQADTTRLFISKFKGPVGPRSIKNIVAKYLNEAGIEDASTHSLRHTFGFHHAIKGTPPSVDSTLWG